MTAQTTDQNSATDGLIHAVAMDGKGGGQDLTWEQLELPRPADADPLWVHIDYTSKRARQWLSSQRGADANVCGALLSEDTRPGVREHEDGLLVNMRGVNLNPGSDPEDMVSVRLWLGNKLIVSTRRRRVLAARSLYDELKTGHGPKTPGEFLVMLVERLEEDIGPAVDQLDESLDIAEEAFQNRSRDSSGYRGEFSRLRREAAHLRRYLAPQRVALEEMARRPNPLLSPSNCLRLRDESDKLTRYLEDIELIRERSMVAQEELLSELALEQNSRIYVLSIVAAVFLPLSFLTGLMGMNVAGLPGTENPLAFGIIVGLTLACAAGILTIFKLKKWF
jgi:zinc transporter